MYCFCCQKEKTKDLTLLTLLKLVDYIMDYASILQEIQQESNGFPTKGNVTLTIPELAIVQISLDSFDYNLEAILVLETAMKKFSIQSISKALTVALAFLFR
jgi:glutaminase